MGIFYALTGILPHNLSNETSWERVFQKIHENINTYKNKDYYFLIANKQDNADFFWNSLKQLKSIVPNGNNLPFQAKWRINREKQKRTHEEAGAFILQVFKESIIKRANIKESFEIYLNNTYKNTNHMTHKANNYITLGQVFTPQFIVDNMLKLIKNNGNILEPSCGDGAFSKNLKNAISVEIDKNVCPDCVIFRFEKDNFSRITNITKRFQVINGQMIFTANNKEITFYQGAKNADFDDIVDFETINDLILHQN